MDSGGSYYATAVKLRGDAVTARKSYPEALGTARDSGEHEDVMHAEALILQAVGFELAAALYCVAQALEDMGQPLREDTRGD